MELPGVGEKGCCSGAIVSWLLSALTEKGNKRKKRAISSNPKYLMNI